MCSVIGIFVTLIGSPLILLISSKIINASIKEWSAIIPFGLGLACWALGFLIMTIPV